MNLKQRLDKFYEPTRKATSEEDFVELCSIALEQQKILEKILSWTKKHDGGLCANITRIIEEGLNEST